jgi:large subunit ribosomal protein L19
MADQSDTTQDNTPVQDQTPEVAETAQIEEVSADTAETTEEAVIDTPKLKFRVGDKVVVNYKIVEGTKARVQPYEGIVIGIKGGGVSKTFTVRRMAAANIGVERIFPMSSPNIESVSIKASGKVRRAKLYYLRERTGKAASKIKERTSHV